MISMTINDKVKEAMHSNAMVHDGSQSGHIPMHFQVHAQLNKGDRVHINLSYGGFWVDNNGSQKYKIHFGGELLYL